ncbi:lpxtg-domain-containing protein [Colletotrichum asianum]
MPPCTISGVDLVNLGPLTTTWPASTSCASAPPSVQLAYATNYKDGVAMRWDNCDVRTDIYNECMPQAELNPQRLDFQLYHSPGIACPADWFTAGLAIKEGPSSYTVNGSFADPTFTRTFPTRTTTMSRITPGFRPSNEIFLSAMEVSETAVICCPW